MIVIFVILCALSIIFGGKIFVLFVGLFLLLVGIKTIGEGLKKHAEIKLKIIGFSLAVMGALTIFFTQFATIALITTGMYALTKVVLVWLIIIERRYRGMG